jgi:acylphosphatase
MIAKGDVIGVGFRAHCMRVAADFGATGYAKNLADSVEVLIECEQGDVEEIIRRIRLPGYVDSLEVLEREVVRKREYSSFNVL